MWRPSFHFCQCVALVLLCEELPVKKVAEVAMKRKSLGTDVRAGTTVEQGPMWHGCSTGLVRLHQSDALVRHISTPTPIYTLWSLPTPVLAHSLLPNSIMPANRRPSSARSHTARGPYKASIIVISSDEDEEPLSVPKRGSRKPRRSRAEGEVLEISEETPVKVDEPELESLQRRCHELEQACFLHCSHEPSI